MLSRIISSTIIVTSGSMIINNKLCSICNNKFCKCNLLANANDNNYQIIDENHNWYNPTNERVFDTLAKSYIPANPYLLQKELKGRNIITIGDIINYYYY